MYMYIYFLNNNVFTLVNVVYSGDMNRAVVCFCLLYLISLSDGSTIPDHDQGTDDILLLVLTKMNAMQNEMDILTATNTELKDKTVTLQSQIDELSNEILSYKEVKMETNEGSDSGIREEIVDNKDLSLQSSVHEKRTERRNRNTRSRGRWLYHINEQYHLSPLIQCFRILL